MVDTGVGHAKSMRRIPLSSAFQARRAIATVSKSKMLSVVSHDSVGNTSVTCECTAASQSRARGRRDNFAIAVAQHEGSHSIWGTNQLCSLVNIRRFAN